MKKRIVCFFGCLFLLVGCGGTKTIVKTAPTPTNRVVDDQLADTARKIHRDIIQLQKIRQEMYDTSKVRREARSYKTPVTGPLAKQITIRWSGGIKELLQVIADKTGYELKVVGQPLPRPVIINLDIIDKPAFEALEDVGWQAGENAGVVLDRDRRIITLIYLG